MPSQEPLCLLGGRDEALHMTGAISYILDQRFRLIQLSEDRFADSQNIGGCTGPKIDHLPDKGLLIIQKNDLHGAGRLEHLLPAWRDAEETKVYAVYPAGRQLPPKVRAFVDFLAARFGDPPYWDQGLAV